MHTSLSAACGAESIAPNRSPHTEADVMVLAPDYPFLNVRWTMIIFLFWVAWIWLVTLILSDVFRRDISGLAKAAWVVFLIVLPFLGAFIYVIANGKEVTERRVRDAAASQAHFDSYVRSVAESNGGAADEIERAKGLLDSGALTQREFEQPRARLSPGPGMIHASATAPA